MARRPDRATAGSFARSSAVGRRLAGAARDDGGRLPAPPLDGRGALLDLRPPQIAQPARLMPLARHQVIRLREWAPEAGPTAGAGPRLPGRRSARNRGRRRPSDEFEPEETVRGERE